MSDTESAVPEGLEESLKPLLSVKPTRYQLSSLGFVQRVLPTRFAPIYVVACFHPAYPSTTKLLQCDSMRVMGAGGEGGCRPAASLHVACQTATSPRGNSVPDPTFEFTVVGYKRRTLAPCREGSWCRHLCHAQAQEHRAQRYNFYSTQSSICC